MMNNYSTYWAITPSYLFIFHQKKNKIRTLLPTSKKELWKEEYKIGVMVSLCLMYSESWSDLASHTLGVMLKTAISFPAAAHTRLTVSYLPWASAFTPLQQQSMLGSWQANNSTSGNPEDRVSKCRVFPKCDMSILKNCSFLSVRYAVCDSKPGNNMVFREGSTPHHLGSRL